MKSNLKTIALETGFSLSTVSRFLCGKKRSYNQKEKYIFEVANKYNYPYIHNFHKHGIKLKVSLVMNIEKGEFYSSLLSDFRIAAKESNCNIEIIDIDKDDLLENKIESLVEKSDGLCILYPDLTRDNCNILESYQNKIPILSLVPILDASINTITFDNHRGGYLAAKSLNDLGYKDVGIISGDDSVFEASQRRNGFMHYISSNNMKCTWEYKGDYTWESGLKAFKDFHSKDLVNIGIFGVNDSMCFAFMREALLSGINIPESVSIIGFDNQPSCNNTIPELSSIYPDYIELARKTLTSIENDFIKYNRTEACTMLLPVNLINRSSTRNLHK